MGRDHHIVVVKSGSHSLRPGSYSIVCVRNGAQLSVDQGTEIERLIFEISASLSLSAEVDTIEIRQHAGEPILKTPIDGQTLRRPDNPPGW